MIVNAVEFEKFNLFDRFDDSLSDFKISFSFWILEKSKSAFNLADNLLDDIDFANEMNESDENDDRNWWKRRSNDCIDDEKIEVTYFSRIDVVRKKSEIIFLLFDRVVIKFSLNLFVLDSKIDCFDSNSKKSSLEKMNAESANCLVISLNCDLERIEIKKSKLRWTKLCSDW